MGYIYHLETCGYVSILQIYRYFSLLLPFSIGMMTARYFKYSEFKERTQSRAAQILLILSLLALMFAYSYIQDYRMGDIYTLIFILLFVLINRPAWLDKFLLEMGNGRRACGSSIHISVITCSMISFYGFSILWSYLLYL